jgi:serine/threonine protein kinase
MSYCLNPQCDRRQNPEDAKFCQNCGEPLILRHRYRVLRPIGRGGFGRTYLAVDRDRLNTACVIKQFAPRAQSLKSLKKSVQLFTQEAVRLRDLGEHSQIPTLLAYFEENQRLYLVQQFIQGYNLAQELYKTGPFSSERIVALLRDLLPVLQFVHENQVIHRDLKPENIIRRKQDGRLVLIDFGVAKQLQSMADYAQPGTKIGTHGYAPAEQLRAGQAFPASDLYSLGAICVTLLTGVPPEELFNPLTESWPWREQLAQWQDAVDPPPVPHGSPETMAEITMGGTTTAIATAEMLPMGEDGRFDPDLLPADVTLMPDQAENDRWLHKLASDRRSHPAQLRISRLPVATRVSEGLGRILDRLLEQSVRDRYASATAVLNDLDRLLPGPAGQSIAVGPLPYLRPPQLRQSMLRFKAFLSGAAGQALFAEAALHKPHAISPHAISPHPPSPNPNQVSPHPPAHPTAHPPAHAPETSAPDPAPISPASAFPSQKD